ncbi:MAG TPA: hypothetical protein VFO55_03535 [Gemmatimonadaceae bacterium]|nr:hypothetical protein [Gemmatimonadaceae bacterium]
MRRALWVAAGAIALAACGEGAGRDNAIRQSTRSYRFTVKADQLPPYANEWVNYTVTVLDKQTDQPVQNGEGQIYGQLTPEGRPYTYDGFVYGPEVGTYHARLRFAISATTADPDQAWQMGLRFRRDSLSPLEIINWQQQVRPERDSIPR